MINKRGDVNVNEILFQLGLTVKDLKRAADGCEDVSSWDMRLVTFQALRTLWMKEMKGRPIDNMWMFIGSFTQALKHSPNSYTVQALVSLFMPQRLYEYGGTKLAWVHDSMLKNWQNIRRRIVDGWGAAKGFSTYTDSGEEDEDCPEDDTVEDRPPQSFSSPQLPSGKKRCRVGHSDFNISFSPDNDDFVRNIMNSNKFVTVCNLKEMATFELGKGK